MRIIRTGCTRIVILIGNYAIKIPNFLTSWRLFLNGLLANMQEYDFSRSGTWHEGKICPVLFGIIGGWLIIMPKVKVLTEEEYDSFRINLPEWKYIGGAKYSVGIIPVEWKNNSFGWYKNKIVSIDYGS